MKKFFLTLLKIGFAGGLITWLIKTDKLALESLAIFVERPAITLALIFNYLLCSVFLGVLRWTILLKALGVVVSFWRGVQLQLIGFFFNTAVPGAVGGDIIKAVYVMRDQKEQRKAPALLSVLLDRIIGVVALFVIATFATLGNLPFIQSHHAVWPVALFCFAGCFALILGVIAVFYPFAEGRDPFHRLLSYPLPLFGPARSAYDALRSFRTQPKVLLSCLGISLVIQLINAAYFWYISSVLTGFSPDILTFGLIFPLGILTTALPLAPGGLGVGHVAFDSLYRIVGWSGGANAFNVMILSSLALNLLGVIPYIFFRTKEHPIEVQELEGLFVNAK